MGLGGVLDDGGGWLGKVLRSSKGASQTGAKGADDITAAGAKTADDAAGAGAKTADDAAGAGAKTADDAAGAGATTGAQAADDAAEAAEAGGKGLIRKSIDWGKDHPILAGAGVLGVGTAGVAGANSIFGSDDKTLDVRRPNGGGPGAGGPDSGLLGGDGPGGAEVLQMDTERLHEFTVGLRPLADHYTELSKQMEKAIKELVMVFSKDDLGAATRDGNPSPGVNDFYQALAEMGAHYIGVAQVVGQQLHKDADALDAWAKAWEETQNEAAQNTDNIDANVSV